MILSRLAAILGAGVEGDGSASIGGAASLDKAGPLDISFVKDARAEGGRKNSKAGALIIPRGMAADRPSIIADIPIHMFSRALDALYPKIEQSAGIHPSAYIDSSAVLGEGVSVGAHVSIGAGTSIGNGSVIRPGARIGADCAIGSNCAIHENAVIMDGVRMGSRCVIHPGAVIGADGFGYVQNKEGVSLKLRHAGNVLLEDDVEIGACSSVDRAMVGSTIIKSGVKIDNQVQVGHNVSIGENTVIAGCTGIAGSVTIGKNVMMGGAASIADHVRIADGVWIAGMTGVHTDLTEPGVYAGPMAMRNMEYKRFILSGKRMDRLEERLKKMEKSGE